MNILVTGGAGYIGSHVVKEILKTDHKPFILDNFSKGHKEAVPAVEIIVGDLKNKEFLDNIFQEYNFDAVIHLAADSLVGESVERPDKYYQNNLVGSINLLEAMKKSNVDKLVFSSTAAVYGEVEELPIQENSITAPKNPYGRSKLFFESILADYDEAFNFKYISLRYFNASGADPDGNIGEDHDPETHLIPIILETALGKRNKLEIYGTDYDTRDGTCIRDYIHVNDLARAHILAVEALEAKVNSNIYNLGSGSGYSVKEVIETARKVTGVKIIAEPTERRPGDPPVLIASSSKIKEDLNWRPKYDNLEKIISTAWNWHKNNPEGFND
ncbi:MAG: UDP-glucose 4-epimerase GalE [bacterium]